MRFLGMDGPIRNLYNERGPAHRQRPRDSRMHRLLGSSASLALFAAAALISPTQPSLAAEADGQAVYNRACAACHESGENRAPPLQALQRLRPESIVESLETGTMAAVGATMRPNDIRAVAAFLGSSGQGLADHSPPPCPDSPWTNLADSARWTSWGGGSANMRLQPTPSAGLDADSVGRLRLRWVLGFPNADRARSQPAVIGDRVFVGSLSGAVYALEASSGCTVWQYDAGAEVRTAIVASEPDGQTPVRLYFGDVKGHLHVVRAEDGEPLWSTRIDDHPAATMTAAPVLFEGMLLVGASSIEEFTGAFPQYSCCSFRGSLAAYDATLGTLLWKTHTIEEAPRALGTNSAGALRRGPSGAAVWAAPTVDAELRRVYVTTGDNYSDPPTGDSDAIIAFDLDDGTRVWSRQFTAGDAYTMACNPRADKANCPEANGPDFDFGASAILVDLGAGQRVLVAGQKSGLVHAVDPDRDGAVLWQKRAGRGGKLGGIQFGPASDGQNVYVAVSDYGRRGAQAAGGITAFRLRDGERIWHTPGFPCPEDRQGCSPAQSAAVTVIPGVVFSGSLDGFLRAYSTDDGSVLWSFDTVREYSRTVNGVPASGGSLNGPGPVAAGGRLFVNSGYGQFGSQPGNAFLAFSVVAE